MIIQDKLKNIKNNLEIHNYKLDDGVFYINKNQGSNVAIKTLIQITSSLKKENLDYRVDHEYNIHVLDK